MQRGYLHSKRKLEIAGQKSMVHIRNSPGFGVKVYWAQPSPLKTRAPSVS